MNALIRVLVMSAVLCLQMPSAQARIVTTEEAATQDQAAVERAKIQAFLDRSGVRERLKALGVDGLMAKQRVAALSDREVHAMAQQDFSLIFSSPDLMPCFRNWLQVTQSLFC